MRKIYLLVLTVLFAGLSALYAHAAPAKIGVLAPIGQTEADVIRWFENVALAEGKSINFKNDNSIAIFEDLTSMIMALRAGQIDKFNINSHTAEYITARNSDFILTNNNHNSILGFSIAMREADKPKMLAINLAINDMKADGTLENLIRHNILELGTDEPIAVELPVFENAEVLKIAVTGDLPPMDCILADGRPAGFNTAFLAELSKRIHKNIQLVSVSAGARQTALSSGKVDALFWTRNTYSLKRELLPYPLDNMSGVVISEPYLFDSRTAISLRSEN